MRPHRAGSSPASARAASRMRSRSRSPRGSPRPLRPPAARAPRPGGDRREGRRPARRAAPSRQARRPRRRGGRRRRGRAWPPGRGRRPASAGGPGAPGRRPRRGRLAPTPLRGRPLEVGRQPLVGPLGGQRRGAVRARPGQRSCRPGPRGPLAARPRSRRSRSPTRRGGGRSAAASPARSRSPAATARSSRSGGGVDHLHRRPRERGDLKQQPPQSAIEPPTRSATSSGSVAGGSAASPGARPAPAARRPSSRAWSGFPPDRSSTARSRARGRARPRRSRSIRPSAARSIGPSSIRWTRSGPSASSSRPGAAPPSCRRVATSHTGDPPRRRSAIAQRPGARLVEPLEVVDPEDHGRPARGLLQGPEHGDGDQEVHGRRAIRLGAEQHRLERPRLGGGERRQHLVGEIRQEVDERGERERGLGLGRARRGRPEPAAACLLEPLAPERRLADPGPARDHERPRPLGAVEEGADLGQLALATEQLGHPRESMTPVRRRVLPVAAKGSPGCLRLEVAPSLGSS